MKCRMPAVWPLLEGAKSARFFTRRQGGLHIAQGGGAVGGGVCGKLGQNAWHVCRRGKEVGG
jgi:hypothetical protein